MTYAWEPWVITDPFGLARRVTAGAGRYLRVSEHGGTEPRTPQERWLRLRAVYEAIALRRLAGEDARVRAGRVQVRAPGEVLGPDGSASELDMTALLCGACLAEGLVPVIVVSGDVGAFALVGLEHGVTQWNAAGRQERAMFGQGPVADAHFLRYLADRGAYVAIDCFGASAAGPCAFETAVERGRARLDGPVRFALDLATAWCGWRIEPYSIGAATEIVAGEGLALRVDGDQLVLARAPDPQIRRLPGPAEPAIGPPRHLLGRNRELAVLRAALAPGTPVAVAGPNGAGKTTLLRALAHGPAPGRYADGTVYLSGHGLPAQDLFSTLFSAFFDADRPYHPRRTDLARYLGVLRALVLIDDAELSDDDLRWLTAAMPGSAIVVADPRSPADATVVALRGIAEQDAVALVERHTGHLLSAADQPAVIELARLTGGHPGSLVLAAAELRAGRPAGQLLAAVVKARRQRRRWPARSWRDDTAHSGTY